MVHFVCQPRFCSSLATSVLVYGGLPDANGVIALTKPMDFARPAAATPTAGATPAATPAVPPRAPGHAGDAVSSHPALVALVRLLARQMAREHLEAEVARHGR